MRTNGLGLAIAVGCAFSMSAAQAQEMQRGIANGTTALLNGAPMSPRDDSFQGRSDRRGVFGRVPRLGLFRAFLPPRFTANRPVIEYSANPFGDAIAASFDSGDASGAAESLPAPGADAPPPPPVNGASGAEAAPVQIPLPLLLRQQTAEPPLAIDPPKKKGSGVFSLCQFVRREKPTESRFLVPLEMTH